MGQKTNPNGLRLGITHTWESKWFAESKDVPKLIKEDALIRNYLNKVYSNIKGRDAKTLSGKISQIEIERIVKDQKPMIVINLWTASPGIIIGKEAATIKEHMAKLAKLTGKQVFINVQEVFTPDKVAILVARNIAEQLENRASFRRAQKMAIQRALKAGAKGVKTIVSGRLGGAEMARSEGYSEGRVPLHTLRADVDYATAEAKTTYGILGVKVWIFHGEVMPGQSTLDTRQLTVKPAGRSDRPARGPRPPQGQQRPPQRKDANKGGN